MELPKETQERIKADAERMLKDQNEILLLNETYMEGYEEGYIAGATAENELAQKLAEALEEIAAEPYTVGVEGCTWGDSKFDSISAAAGYNQAIDNITAKVRKHLQQWNAGKEVEG